MTQYKGYYIDHVVFNSKADIDNFIKKQTLERYIRECKRFAEKPSMELSKIMDETAAHLRKYGYTWEQIEQIEIKAFNAC